MTAPKAPAIFSPAFRFTDSDPPQIGYRTQRRVRSITCHAEIINVTRHPHRIFWGAKCAHCGGDFTLVTDWVRSGGLPRAMCDGCYEWKIEAGEIKGRMAEMILARIARDRGAAPPLPPKEDRRRASAAAKREVSTRVEALEREVAELRALLRAQAAGKVSAPSED